MGELLDALARYYQHGIVESGKQPQFFILLSFVVTFAAVRAITHAIRAGRGGRLFRNVSRGDTHIHHLVWGIALLLLTGYLAIAFGPDLSPEPLAVLFGIGAALTLDEFALWLDLRDVYWERQGRWSIDAVVITGAVFGLVLVGMQFWVDVGRELGRLVGIG